MLNEEITVNNLSEKVNDLLVRFTDIQQQNQILRQEVVTLKAQNEMKDIQIAKLEEDMMNKDIESDDIFAKIEEVLRK
jgi:cell division protein FtsB